MKSTTIKALALDLGTTSIKAGLLDELGQLIVVSSKPAPKLLVNGGKYEGDAIAYASTAELLLNEIHAQAESCGSLGLCSQRSTFVIWDSKTGLPVTPLISWQDDRGARSCNDLKRYEKLIKEIGGLPLTPYYFAPKLREVLRQNPDWLRKLETGQLLVGTLDTFVLWRWSGGKYHVTDVSMAARTLLMDIARNRWSETLCALFGIPINILPQIRPSDGLELRLDNGLNLKASIADQSAALISSVTEDGDEVLVNLGTGCFVVRFVPDTVPTSNGLLDQGYLHTLVYQEKRGSTHFAIEGTLNSIASVLTQYPVEVCTFEELAANDIFCVCEPNGMGAPFFVHRQFAGCHSDPRHISLGVQFSDSVAHLSPREIGALLLEAVIFRVARILEDFHLHAPVERVLLAGGLSELASLRQGIATCAGCEVMRLTQTESSLLGVSLLAAGLVSGKPCRNEPVPIGPKEAELCRKYLSWRDWLDKLITTVSSQELS